MLRNFCQRTGKRGLPYLTDITNVFESVQFLLVNVLPTAEQQEKKKKEWRHNIRRHVVWLERNAMWLTDEY